MRLVDAEFEERHYLSMVDSPTPDVTESDKRTALAIARAFQMARTVEPERKTGRWVKHNESTQLLYGESKGGVKCSECGYTTHNKMHVLVGCPWKYCPNCGAKMEGAAYETKDD